MSLYFLAALWTYEKNVFTNQNGITIKGMWKFPALGKPGYIANDDEVLSVVGETEADAKKNGAQVKKAAKETEVVWKKNRQMWTRSKNMTGTKYFALTNVLSEKLLHANSKGIMSIEHTIPVVVNRTKDLEVPDGMKENKGISIINIQFISLK